MYPSGVRTLQLVFLSLALAACGGGGAKSSPDLSQAVEPDLEPAALTWTDGGQAFFAKYCVGCHKPGGQAAQQDFSQYAVVVANAVDIRCGVTPAGQMQSGCGSNPAPGQFPIGNGAKPSDAERLAIVAWIDAGTPN